MSIVVLSWWWIVICSII